MDLDLKHQDLKNQDSSLASATVCGFSHLSKMGCQDDLHYGLQSVK